MVSIITLAFIFMLLGTVLALLGAEKSKRDLVYVGIIFLELSAFMSGIYYYVIKQMIL